MSRKRKLKDGRQEYGGDMSRAGIPLTPTEIESLRQLYLLHGNKSEVSRQMHLSLPTINKYLKIIAEQDSDPGLVMARKQSHERLASKVAVKAHQIIDTMKPEDFETHREIVRNADGTIKSVKEYGPSLLQKTTALAILTDKMKVLREIEGGMRDDNSSGQLLLPQDLHSIIEAVQGKISRLTVLNIQMAPEQKQTLDKAQEVLVQAEIARDDGPRMIEIGDFDPSPADSE